MNDTWDSADIDAAIQELNAAGWRAKTPTLWRSPDGKLYAGPAGAWKVMKRMENDDRLSPPVAPDDTPTPQNPTRDATRECAEWLAACIGFGWKHEDLDALEAMWWKYHDRTGKLITHV